MKQINQYEEITSASSGDWFLLQPNGGGIYKKITKSNLGISGVGGGIEYAKIADVKPFDAQSGAYNANTDATRTLNTVINPAAWLSLSNNQFTLQPGVYIIRAEIPGYLIGQFRGWVHNISTGVRSILGQGAFSSTSVSAVSRAVGQISLLAATTFEIRMRGNTTRNQNGGGVAAMTPGEAEVYTVVEIEKIG